MTKKERLQIKVDLLALREKGMITVDDVYELADSLDMDYISKPEAQRIIRKACKAAGY